MGLVLMLGTLLQIPFGAFLWPFIFIIPGGLVLLAALGSSASSGEGLSILGGILTSLGIMFLAQSISGWWASWAYAWTLVAPTSVGFAQVLYGQQQNREEIIKSGRRFDQTGVDHVCHRICLLRARFGCQRVWPQPPGIAGLPDDANLCRFAGIGQLISTKSLLIDNKSPGINSPGLFYLRYTA